jgi:hypothetical protein
MSGQILLSNDWDRVTRGALESLEDVVVHVGFVLVLDNTLVSIRRI